MKNLCSLFSKHSGLRKEKTRNRCILKEIKRMINFRFKYFTILFFILCFSEFSFAERLNPEQIKLIESLAFPLEEPMTFYHVVWNSTIAEQMVEEGEITPENYQLLATKKRGITGLYLAESISSLELMIGTTLIEVEVEKGVRVLDIEAHRDTLLRAGIKAADLYALDMDNLLLSVFKEEVDDWWVFKGRTGVKFKPFSIQNASLQDLFIAQRLDFVRRMDLFYQIDFEGHVKKRVKQALAAPIEIENVTDAMSLFALGESYFSPEEREKALNLVLNNTNNMEDSLKLFKQWKFPQSKLKQIVKANHHARSENRGLRSLPQFPQNKEVNRFYERLSPDEAARLFNHVLDHASTIQDALSFIIYSDSQGRLFDDKYLKQIAEKVKDQPIRSLKEANAFLFRARDLLSAEDLNRIIERTIPFLENVKDSIDLLNNRVISSTNKAKIYERIPSFTLDIGDDKWLLKLLPFGVPIELENYIVQQEIENRHAFGIDATILFHNLSEENQENIIDYLLRRYREFGILASFFTEFQDHISPTQKNVVLDRLADIASFKNINQLELSQFKDSVSNTDFQYFVQALKKRPPSECSKVLLNSL